MSDDGGAMLIHEEQQNVEQFCEIAEFVDSGFQSFREQVKHLPREKMTEAAFFTGVALAFKLMAHFNEANEKFGAETAGFLRDLVLAEIDEYLERNGLRLEWFPHVPRHWQQ